jgi:PhnB protein
MKRAFGAKETERYSMPDGSIGHAEIRIGDSVIIVVDAQGEEYKSMAAGTLHLFSWIYTSEILQQLYF